MRSALAVAFAFAATLTGCRDQRKACTDAMRRNARYDNDPLIEQCVREKWSDNKIECMLRAGGGFGGMFCED
jgi:hypothetical protein